MIRQNNELMANAFENSSRQMTAHRKKKMQMLSFMRVLNHSENTFSIYFFFSLPYLHRTTLVQSGLKHE